MNPAYIGEHGWWINIIICRQVDDYALVSMGEKILKISNELPRKVRIIAEKTNMKRLNGTNID